MRAGQLRHRITIEQPTTSKNEFGEEEETWSTFATRWARVSPLEGQERWAAEQFGAQVTHEVELRHLDGITTEMRVNHDSRHLYIESALNPDERNRALLLHCREQVD